MNNDINPFTGGVIQTFANTSSKPKGNLINCVDISGLIHTDRDGNGRSLSSEIFLRKKDIIEIYKLSEYLSVDDLNNFYDDDNEYVVDNAIKDIASIGVSITGDGVDYVDIKTKPYLYDGEMPYRITKSTSNIIYRYNDTVEYEAGIQGNKILTSSNNPISGSITMNSHRRTLYFRTGDKNASLTFICGDGVSSINVTTKSDDKTQSLTPINGRIDVDIPIGQEYKWTANIKNDYEFTTQSSRDYVVMESGGEIINVNTVQLLAFNYTLKAGVTKIKISSSSGKSYEDNKNSEDNKTGTVKIPKGDTVKVTIDVSNKYKSITNRNLLEFGMNDVVDKTYEPELKTFNITFNIDSERVREVKFKKTGETIFSTYNKTFQVYYGDYVYWYCVANTGYTSSSSETSYNKEENITSDKTFNATATISKITVNITKNEGITRINVNGTDYTTSTTLTLNYNTPISWQAFADDEYNLNSPSSGSFTLTEYKEISPTATKKSYPVKIDVNTGVDYITITTIGNTERITSSTTKTYQSGTILNWNAYAKTNYLLDAYSGKIELNKETAPTAIINPKTSVNKILQIGLQIEYTGKDNTANGSNSVKLKIECKNGVQIIGLGGSYNDGGNVSESQPRNEITLTEFGGGTEVTLKGKPSGDFCILSVETEYTNPTGMSEDIYITKTYNNNIYYKLEPFERGSGYKTLTIGANHGWAIGVDPDEPASTHVYIK